MAEQPRRYYRIAVLMASYNRRDMTLRCIQQLLSQQNLAAELHVYLVDDNSSDGTATAVAELFPQVTLISGSGCLYWSGAMRLAWQHASVANYDFYLWLNDDVKLLPDALARLLACYSEQCSRGVNVGAVVGALQAGPDHPVSYGGRLQLSKLFPLRFSEHLALQDVAQPLDVMNGNCCLITAAAYAAVGGISEHYVHALADYDYSLRLKHAGFAVLQAPGSMGFCRQNGWGGGVRDPRVPLSVRRRWLSMPNKWVPVADWQYFVRCYGGVLWPWYWGKAALRALYPTAFLRFNTLKAVEVDARPQVVIIQQVIKHFRLPFYLLLQQRLAEQGIALTVYYSAPAKAEAMKGDNCTASHLPAFFHEIPCYRMGKLTWQSPPFRHPKQLVIIEQANRHLLNYWLLLQRFLGCRSEIAWWGHGFNHQGERGWREKIKVRLLRSVDWFFAYTQPVAEYVRLQGFPATQISVVNNAIDTQTFAQQVLQARVVPPAAKKGITLLFCGALYAEKRLDLLLAAATLLAEQGLLSKLIVLGDGPERTALAAPASWLEYRGVLFDQAKAAAYAEADIVLHPGLVGLAILDAFAAGLPFVTCKQANHSPEIAYLKPGENGLMVAAEPMALAAALTTLWQTPALYHSLSAGARAAAEQYSIEGMAEAFAQGIQACLESPL